ncbi:hypothetical protein QBZ16_002162 [Prototheca wickerhamii]|uniref:Uncharacterized protein n=1 Tax=Prototheca wickerhamii TaxID=3111 RepID=A0AAD9IP37_PROWI|nr:hypothetical protein QBZ16_002162 [Prototheca wickerhamii]
MWGSRRTRAAARTAMTCSTQATASSRTAGWSLDAQDVGHRAQRLGLVLPARQLGPRVQQARGQPAQRVGRDQRDRLVRVAGRADQVRRGHGPQSAPDHADAVGVGPRHLRDRLEEKEPRPRALARARRAAALQLLLARRAQRADEVDHAGARQRGALGAQQPVHGGRAEVAVPGRERALARRLALRGRVLGPPPAAAWRSPEG